MPRICRLNIVRCLLAAVLALSASLAHATYWNVFNIEGESTEAAHIVTYGMLADTNRVGDFTMSSFGRNIVGSGSDVLAGGGPTGSVPEPGSLSLVALAGLIFLTLRTPWRYLPAPDCSFGRVRPTTRQADTTVMLPILACHSAGPAWCRWHQLPPSSPASSWRHMALARAHADEGPVRRYCRLST
jgi:hypothetical protein